MRSNKLWEKLKLKNLKVFMLPANIMCAYSLNQVEIY